MATSHSVGGLGLPDLEVQLPIVRIELELDHLHFVLGKQVDLMDQVVLEPEELVFAILRDLLVIIFLVVAFGGIVGKVIWFGGSVDPLAEGNSFLVAHMDVPISLDIDGSFIGHVFVFGGIGGLRLGGRLREAGL